MWDMSPLRYTVQDKHLNFRQKREWPQGKKSLIIFMFFFSSISFVTVHFGLIIPKLSSKGWVHTLVSCQRGKGRWKDKQLENKSKKSHTHTHRPIRHKEYTEDKKLFLIWQCAHVYVSYILIKIKQTKTQTISVYKWR